MSVKRISVVFLAVALATTPAAFGFEGMGKASGGAAAPSGKPAPSTTPETVAKVNGEKISGMEFDRNWNAYLQQRGMPAGHGGKSSGGNDDQFTEMKKEVLDNLIAGELLWQDAKKKGALADPKDVEARVEKVKMDIGGQEKFAEFLKANNVDEKYYRDFINKQFSIRKLLDDSVVKGIAVSDKDVHDYYVANPDRFKSPEQVKASHILCKVEKDATPEQKAATRKEIEGILEEAKKGADFAELATKHSDCPSSAKGGDLGTFGRNRMVKPFEDAAFSINKVGDISGVIETEFGYHIIKLTDRKDAGIVSEKDASESIKQSLTQQKTREAIEGYVKKLREKAKVDVQLAL